MRSPLRILNTDAALLERIRNGDEQSLVVLFEETRSMAFSFVQRNGGTSEEAPELLQEAVVILWERVREGSFDADARLSTYLLGVIKNLLLRRHARRKREVPLAEEFDPPSESPSALEDMIDEEQREAIKRAMELIGEMCRKILLLFYWEQRPMGEIAAAVGLANAETAKSKKYQCKKSLETHLKSMMGHE